MKTVANLPIQNLVEEIVTVKDHLFDPVSITRFQQDAMDYGIDAVQKTVLFMDVLRKRGNIFWEHLEKGKPPVLTFNYKIIVDGRSLERPVNHDLIQIIPKKGITVDPGERPIVVVDPRAGHGPGIGGSKRDSQIGMAMEAGHPVYFITFYPEPCPGQTYEDVKSAQTRFVEEVNRRHPDAGEPMMIGNCQAGWAIALLSADRPDITGPLILNGSPLSYWSGVAGQNVMRYQGGLWGGVWIISLLTDLCNGQFDGANLVGNFENLNPGNTWWTKQYNVWANVDTEAERYLNFEKWWNGYFFMTAEEIHFIVSNLFIANKLEQGKLELEGGKKIDLKNLDDPVLVFASKGDNITPPQQALNWIATVYGSVEEIKRRQQSVIYMVHEKIGHLGIFVSGSVAQKEHKQIIRSIDMLDFLPPGLYEMRIEEKREAVSGLTDYEVRFVERDISDIMALDDGRGDEIPFIAVARISEINDHLYTAHVRPWIRAWSNPLTADMMRWMHPLRFSRYAYSDINPLMWPYKSLAPFINRNRRPANPANPFMAMEKAASASIVAGLDLYRDVRDAATEFAFTMLFENPWTRAMFAESEAQGAESAEHRAQRERNTRQLDEDDRKRWRDQMDKGGVMEGIIRVIVAMADADAIFDQREFDAAEKIIKTDKRFEKVKRAALKRMVKEQSRILETDTDRALASLETLLPTQQDRKEAYDVAMKIAASDLVVDDREAVVMARLKEMITDEE